MAKTVTWLCRAASNSNLSPLVGSLNTDAGNLRVDNNSPGRAYAYYKDGYLTFGADSSYTPFEYNNIESITLTWNAWTSSALLAADLICHSVKADGTEGADDTIALKYNGQNQTASSSLNTAALVNGGRVKVYIKLLHKGITSYCIARNFRVKITYNPKTYHISATKTGNGSIIGTGYYEKGTSVTLTAAADTGWEFSNWSDGEVSPSRTITVTGAQAFHAIFIKKQNYTIGFLPNGATGGSMPNASAVFGTGVTLTNRFTRSHTVSFDAGGGQACSARTANATFLGFSDTGSIEYDYKIFSPGYFDAPFYANRYSDLMNAYGYNKFNLVRHWEHYGRGEGRTAVGSSPGLYPNGATVTSLTTEETTVNLKAEWQLGSITLPSTVRSGYNFLGWYTDSSFTQRVGGAGDTYTPTVSGTLYAKWERNSCPLIVSVEVNPNPANIGQGYIVSVGIGD